MSCFTLLHPCAPLIPAWISNNMPSKVCDKITYPFPNFNGCTVEVWEWIINFIPHFIMFVITYYWLNYVGKRGPCSLIYVCLLLGKKGVGISESSVVGHKWCETFRVTPHVFNMRGALKGSEMLPHICDLQFSSGFMGMSSLFHQQIRGLFH